MPEHLIAFVMALYSNARSRIRTLAGTSDEFGIGVGVHQGSVVDATREARGEGLLDLLYADDLVITAESEEEAVRKFGVWKIEMETRGLKVHINMTKLMVMLREAVVRP